MSPAEFSPSEIVLIRHVPLDDPSAVKARPALIISNSSFNRTNLDVIVVAISSVVRHGDARQIVLPETDCAFPQTGLKMTSAVKCGAVFAYPRSEIRRRLGVVSRETLGRVRTRLIEFLTGD
jgi:mRNA-degrading endonuclease toxin of MazEF toxin-antitoxin module